MYRELIARLKFVVISFLTGVDELGGFYSRHRVAGFALLAGFFGVSLGLPLLGFAWNSSTGIAIAGTVMVIVGVNGAYVEFSRRAPLGDDEEALIASLSDRTKQCIRAWSTTLISGHMGAGGLDPPVVAELQAKQLVTISYAQPGPRALGQYAAPNLNLTPLGASIVQRVLQDGGGA